MSVETKKDLLNIIEQQGDKICFLEGQVGDLCAVIEKLKKENKQIQPCPFCKESYGIERIADCQHYDRAHDVYCC